MQITSQLQPMTTTMQPIVHARHGTSMNGVVGEKRPNSVEGSSSCQSEPGASPDSCQGRAAKARRGAVTN